MGTVIHELLHVLGFFHMQSGSLRDQYVTIMWDEIQPNRKRNFNAYSIQETTSFGLPYDFESVLHYPKSAFSKNKRDTIVPKV